MRWSACAVAALVLLVATRAAAFDPSSWWKTLPQPLQRGDLIVSATCNIGHADPIEFSATNAMMYGVSVAFDWAPAIDFPVPLTVGVEVGADGSLLNVDRDISLGVLPVMFRLAWHPDWGVRGLNSYVMVKIGDALAFWTGNDRDIATTPNGLALGFGAGGRYFFSDHIGLFIDLGYDRYFLHYKYSTEPTPYHAFGKHGHQTAYVDKIFSCGITYRL
jgi:hypothetical protein